MRGVLATYSIQPNVKLSVKTVEEDFEGFDIKLSGIQNNESKETSNYTRN